ncbi:type II secretion system protein GspM [Nitrospira sp.]|nr:type II secretion system protein GspM [Nitrospira sp.]
MDTLRQRWADFSPRERWVIGIGTMAAVLSVLFVVLVDPLLERITILDRQHARKARDYEELAKLEGDYRQLQVRMAQLEQRLARSSGQFALLPFLEETATSTGIRDQIVAMQPQPTVPMAGYEETAVEIRLDGMHLPQLLSLLAAVENAPALVQVKRLQITPRYDTPYLLQVTIRVASYEKA